jgi:hypothetical protein
MSNDADLKAMVRSIIDSNRYLTLGTADENGRPWASPVYFASADCVDFYWISTLEATHSRNLAQRPELSIVIFDSQVLPGHGRAVYMTGTAGQVSGPDFDRGLEIYPGPLERGVRAFSPDELTAPDLFRLFRARMSEHWVLCPREPRQPCARHGIAHDHRVDVPIT